MSKQSLLQQCQKQYYLLLLALSFFTRVPVNLPNVVKPEMLHKASRYFALIGLFIGVVTALMLSTTSMPYCFAQQSQTKDQVTSANIDPVNNFSLSQLENIAIELRAIKYLAKIN